MGSSEMEPACIALYCNNIEVSEASKVSQAFGVPNLMCSILRKVDQLEAGWGRYVSCR